MRVIPQRKTPFLPVNQREHTQGVTGEGDERNTYNAVLLRAVMLMTLDTYLERVMLM